MKSLLLVALFPLFALAEVSLISVQGAAMKAVDPNIVNLQVEIWSRANQAKSAQESVAKEYARIKSLVEKYKIKKEDFETINYNLAPETEYNQKGGSRIVGYRASQSVQIIHRKVEEAGTLIDALSSQAKADTGGVIIQSIAWDYDKKEQVEFALISEAVKDARRQADELAKASNVKIKGVYRLTNTSETEPVRPMHKVRMEMAADMASASTEVAAGSVKVKVLVSADYQIAQ